MPYSFNGDFEQLVEQITDVIYARLNGHADDQARMCGCTSECFHRCPERMHRVVDAGAARIGLILGQTASARDWASLIDHTLLKPDASQNEIKHLCEEAAHYHFASVCVNPTWVRACACHLQGSGVPVCTVIGFPLGATLPDVKAYEARRAIMDGAREVDMVINIGALKSGDFSFGHGKRRIAVARIDVGGVFSFRPLLHLLCGGKREVGSAADTGADSGVDTVA